MSIHPYRCFIAAAAIAILGATPGAKAADSDTILGIHFWGDRTDSTPATMLDSNTAGGYDTEIVNTDNFAYGGWHDEDVVDPLYQNFKSLYNITPITRLGYYWGQTLPAPGTTDYTNWPSYIATNDAARMKDTAHLWQLGNEPNLHGEATNWPSEEIQPTDYATVYRNVRNAIKSASVTGAAGTHLLLVAPPSPGDIAGDRWMSGDTWLDQTLSDIPANEVDGVALHSYGAGTTARASFQTFRQTLLDQISVVDNRGLSQVPIYLTEWNRATEIGSSADEAVTADFVRQSLQFLDRWNRTPGNHNIVASTWFVYDWDGANDGVGWDAYSIEGFKDTGNNPASPTSIYNAFYTSARAGYKAGIAGMRPIPSGVQIFDDFENTDGHFANAQVSTATAGTTGIAGGFKVDQNDTDSYTKNYAEKIGITDDPSNPAGWTVRYVSGNGSPSQNVPINLTAGRDGDIGFFLRVYTINGSETTTGASGLTAQIAMDSGPIGGGNNTDISTPLTINPDGNWHWYEWSLDDPAQWQGWSLTGSDGKLGVNGDFVGQVTLDSLVFSGPNGISVEYLLDTVMRNSDGSLNVMAGLPEPSAMAPLLLLGLACARVRRRVI